MTHAPTHSLIIPAYNEAVLLPRLLDTVEVARRRYVGGADRVEVIVADNASTDTTAVLAAARGCRVVRVEKRIIAAVRNGGAAVAQGTVLAFVDADNQIHPDTFNVIARALANPRIIAGATGVTMERWSLGITVSYFMILVPFLMLAGIDTGVTFCRRTDFQAVGGYDERRLWAEDVAFLWALRRLGRAKGQRLVRLRGAKAIWSTRKFDRYGDWHYFHQVPRIAVRLLRQPTAAVHDFVREYWYEDPR